MNEKPTLEKRAEYLEEFLACGNGSTILTVLRAVDAAARAEERERCARLAVAWASEEDGNGNSKAYRALRDFSIAIRKEDR